MAYLSRLTLANYRNFREADIALPPGVSLFAGDNAQGKTALLEAAYTLAIGRSFRAAREREVVNFDAARRAQPAYITGIARRDDQTITAVIGYRPASPAPSDPPPSDPASPSDPDDDDDGAALPSVTKQIRVNRQPATAAGLMGRIGIALFSVDDLELALGAPSHRRRYLDVLLCQAQRPYLSALQRYQAALRQRNGLLRRRRDAPVAPEEMAYWDEQLTQSGAIVTLTRAASVTRLSDLAAAHYRELAEPGDTLSLAYRPSVPPQSDAKANTDPDANIDADAVDAAAAAATAAAFRELLRQRAARELARGTTAAGPHRDDCAIFSNGRAAGAFASRGQARTIALALRLAEADYLAEARQDAPIILLDDVFSEMDAARRERVLHRAARYGQTLLTATDAAPLRAILGDRAAGFRVANGAVVREN